MLSFTIEHEPIPQPRQRHRIIRPKRGKPFIQNYTPAKHPVNDLKQATIKAAKQAHWGDVFKVPIAISVVFWFPRPTNKIWKTKPMDSYPHTGATDIDNLLKPIMDALTGILWKNDGQVCNISASKYVCSGQQHPHIEFFMRDLRNDEEAQTLF